MCRQLLAVSNNNVGLITILIQLFVCIQKKYIKVSTKAWIWKGTCVSGGSDLKKYLLGTELENFVQKLYI